MLRMLVDDNCGRSLGSAADGVCADITLPDVWDVCDNLRRLPTGLE